MRHVLLCITAVALVSLCFVFAGANNNVQTASAITAPTPVNRRTVRKLPSKKPTCEEILADAPANLGTEDFKRANGECGGHLSNLPINTGANSITNSASSATSEDCDASSPASAEGCVITDLREIHAAELEYAATTGDGNFGSLAQLAAGNLIRPAMTEQVRHGYVFTLVIHPKRARTELGSFSLTATPEKYPSGGLRSFFVSVEGIVRGADHRGKSATASDPSI